MQTRLTVYFEDPFWVGVFERQGEDFVQAARVVFGSEPSDAEVLAWILAKHRSLDFGPPVAVAIGEAGRVSGPKRRLREARQALAARGAGTRAHEAMRLAHEARKTERDDRNRQRREIEAGQRFVLRTEKRKKKRRGH